MRTGEQDWKAVAKRLAQRLAQGADYPMDAEEVLTRAYNTREHLLRGTAEERRILGKVWQPAQGAWLYYGELTTAHLDNILAFAESRLASARRSGRGLFGWTAQASADATRWIRVQEDLLKVKAFRRRQGE